MTTCSFRQAFGRGVISSDNAESLGSVKGFVLDGRGGQIEAIHVDGRGKRSTVLDWSSVRAFGADAVMATPGAAPSPVDGDHAIAAVRGTVSMLGARVLTIQGQEIGNVDDVEFDTESGAVVLVHTDHGPLGGAQLRSLGSYALVVDTADTQAAAPPVDPPVSGERGTDAYQPG